MAKACVALIVWLCLAYPAGAAQNTNCTKKPVRPAWSELAPAHQQVLGPLRPDWDQMDATRHKKWVEVGKAAGVKVN